MSTLDRTTNASSTARFWTGLHRQASGWDTVRPQLTELLLFACDGRTVVAHSMDRVARNLDDLRAPEP